MQLIQLLWKDPAQVHLRTLLHHYRNSMTLFQTTRRTRSCGPARRSLQISGASIRPAPLSLLLFLSALFASMATVLGANAPSDSGDTLGVTHDNDMQVLAADSASTRYFYGGKATVRAVRVARVSALVHERTGRARSLGRPMDRQTLCLGY